VELLEVRPIAQRCEIGLGAKSLHAVRLLEVANPLRVPEQIDSSSGKLIGQFVAIRFVEPRVVASRR
jgi:hypothetical protein